MGRTGGGANSGLYVIKTTESAKRKNRLLTRLNSTHYCLDRGVHYTHHDIGQISVMIFDIPRPDQAVRIIAAFKLGNYLFVGFFKNMGQNIKPSPMRHSQNNIRIKKNFPLAATASMTYSYFMVIIETPIFTKQLLSTLSDDEYRLFQANLLERPDAGKIIPGGGGLRKVRWALPGRGKSGGVRVIYYWFTALETILLLFMYPKNVQDNLTQNQLKQLKMIIEEEYHER